MSLLIPVSQSDTWALWQDRFITYKIVTDELKTGFKKSVESDTTRPSRNRLGPNRVDTDTGYVGML